MNFLLFRKLISIQALIVFYYLGATIFPIFLYFNYKKNSENFFWKKLNKNIHITPSKKQIYLTFLTILMFMELFWRILFEFLISYIQVRDKVLEIIIK